jgi:hypothetical protein
LHDLQSICASAMLALNICIEFGGYGAAYRVAVARWFLGDIHAAVAVKVSPLTAELNISLEIEGFRMEFTVVRS